MAKKGYQIKWTKNATNDYNKVIDYLLENWCLKGAENFSEIVASKLNILSENAYIGVSSQKIKDVRSILLTKHNRLYYRIKNGAIELLNILDTRQNQKKNQY